VESPEKFLGYFPLKNLNDALDCKKYIDLMQTAVSFRFNVFDMISSLIYARTVHPCSKFRTYEEVFPKLFEKDEYGTEELFDFMHDFRVAKVSDRKYINLTRNSSFIKGLSAQTGLPLTSYFLGNEDIKKC